MSVCADKSLSIKEIEERSNLENPTGISSQWQKADRSFNTGESNPCVCEEDVNRLHYLLEC